MPGLPAIAACIVLPSRGEQQFRPAAEKDVFAARRQDARRSRKGPGRDAGTEAKYVQHFRRLRRRIGVEFLDTDAGEKPECMAHLMKSSRIEVNLLALDAVARIEVESDGELKPMLGGAPNVCCSASGSATAGSSPSARIGAMW